MKDFRQQEEYVQFLKVNIWLKTIQETEEEEKELESSQLSLEVYLLDQCFQTISASWLTSKLTHLQLHLGVRWLRKHSG